MRGLGLKLWLFLYLICQHNLCNRCSHLHHPSACLKETSPHGLWSDLRPARLPFPTDRIKGYGTAGALTHADLPFILRISTPETCLFWLFFHIFPRLSRVQWQQPEQIKGDLSARLMGGALYSCAGAGFDRRLWGIGVPSWTKTKASSRESTESWFA